MMIKFILDNYKCKILVQISSTLTGFLEFYILLTVQHVMILGK